MPWRPDHRFLSGPPRLVIPPKGLALLGCGFLREQLLSLPIALRSFLRSLRPGLASVLPRGLRGLTDLNRVLRRSYWLGLRRVVARLRGFFHRQFLRCGRDG